MSVLPPRDFYLCYSEYNDYYTANDEIVDAMFYSDVFLVFTSVAANTDRLKDEIGLIRESKSHKGIDLILVQLDDCSTPCTITGFPIVSVHDSNENAAQHISCSLGIILEESPEISNV